jgi:N-acetylglucosaminyldiphosphoundecaprenol N-acetyl-beta-D-mannosaminyltransferase
MKGKLNILGIGVSDLTVEELNQQILMTVKEERKALILNVNIHAMNMADKYRWFKELLNSSEIVFCDGDGVRLGARILGLKIKEKITYNRWIWEFAKFSETHKMSWYLIGSNEDVIKKSVGKLRSLYPRLAIRGYRNGFFIDDADHNNTIKDINLKKPDILILGMGMPIQEKWLLDNWDNIDATVALTGGAVFEYVSGVAKMTPDLFFKLKMEWFYRFIQEPKRLFKRYFIGNTKFMTRVIHARLRGIRSEKNAKLKEDI